MSALDKHRVRPQLRKFEPKLTIDMSEVMLRLTALAPAPRQQLTVKAMWACVLTGFGLAVILRVAFGPQLYGYIFPQEFIDMVTDLVNGR